MVARFSSGKAQSESLVQYYLYLAYTAVTSGTETLSLHPENTNLPDPQKHKQLCSFQGDSQLPKTGH